MHRLGLAARPLFAAAGIWANDSCFGMIGPKDLAESFPWVRYFPHLPSEGCVEWFVHPGEADDSLIGRDTYLRERVVELESLEHLGHDPLWQRWKEVLRTKSSQASPTFHLPLYNP